MVKVFWVTLKSKPSLYGHGVKRMLAECKYCKKTVEPKFKMDAGIDSYVCPACGNTIDACTDNIQVIGRDM